MSFGAPDFYRKTREKAEETRTIFRSGALTPETWETLLNLPGRDVTVEFMELSSNYAHLRLLIHAFRADGSYLEITGVPWYDGSSIAGLTFYAVHTYESILWYELVYDDTNKRYKMGLGPPLRFANGINILAYATNPGYPVNFAILSMMTVRS